MQIQETWRFQTATRSNSLFYAHLTTHAPCPVSTSECQQSCPHLGSEAYLNPSCKSLPVVMIKFSLHIRCKCCIRIPLPATSHNSLHLGKDIGHKLSIQHRSIEVTELPLDHDSQFLD
ncbi:hypothetical protein ILYODFUR_005102 [Ilyodon furcidens]|uniref:Uncharacterized protein n=1 Tax=Ilyodon furcidens TaxID=33524 RepID=A0ABV0UHK8_9TELE